MAVDRFLGPYHASQIVDYATKCPYAFKLQNVEQLPEQYRHGKALLGDVVHFLLEAYHRGEHSGAGIDDNPDLNVWEYWREVLKAQWDDLIERGNPRYPERSMLPMYWGRVKAIGGSREMERGEFEEKWLPKAVQWLVEYTSQAFNWEWHNKKGPETILLEIGYRLNLVDDKGKGGYVVLGRFDQIRKHYSLETVPRSLRDQERIRPGGMAELHERLKKRGYLLELSDWKSGKDRPIYWSQKDPWVTFTKQYQPRLYALGLAEGEIGSIDRVVVKSGVAEEVFTPIRRFGEMPDFYTWHHLPGYERRQKGDRNPLYKGRRFKAGTEPVDLYQDGKAPGDLMDADPRVATLIRPHDLEATRKDVRRVIASIRLNQFFRAPGQFTCTSCRFTRECEQDLDKPILDSKFFAQFDEDDYFLDDEPAQQETEA